MIREGRGRRVPRAVSARRVAVTFCAALAAATAAGCAVGPSDRPAVAVRESDAPPMPATPSAAPPTGLPPLQQRTEDLVKWSDCTDSVRAQLAGNANRPQLRFDCATIVVDLDPERSQVRGRAEIGVVRVGGDRADTKPPLVVIGEVGDAPGSLLAAQLATQVPQQLLDTFTLIGLDRRGTGTSDAVRCVPPDARQRAVGIDSAAPQPAGVDTVLDAARDAAQTCVQELDERLTLVDSWLAAGDLERLRTDLGAQRLNALAVGEGTGVLGTYLHRYPETIGRVVLDGAADPTDDAVAGNEQRATAAEAAFDAYATSCAAAPGCPLGADPRATVTDLATRLRANPLPGPGGVSVDAGLLDSALLAGLSDPDKWQALNGALAAAAGGDGTGLAGLIAPLLQPSTVAGDRAEAPRADAALMTTCNDSPTRVPPDRVVGLAADWQAKHPLFGGTFAQRLLLCSPWPVPSRPALGRRTGGPPVLMLATTADPVTPSAGAAQVAAGLGNTATVTWQHAGHRAYPRTPCLTNAVQDFLVAGTVPADGTICPP